ncbi:nSTAND1 domain-containing NTPase [Streptomyces daliensis]|uniref:PD40 domain-containing protein n=1 Tax=Streptomyces daliensis TaxID=299421 RepID=A0A8T4J3S6_9ACTN|nr:PD40 domain-containing protein [Streptomyces daliensis]
MGRREVPVDPSAGPVQRFAYELRKLREEAGGPTYRQLAARADYSVTTLSQAAAGERLPSLAVTLAYARACGGEPETWELCWREAAAEAAEAAAAVPEDGAGAEPPYRGLARFEPGDEKRFHGRSQLTADLLDLVTEHRFAAVFGPSGSGKSSLLRAGLIPALRGSDAPERADGADGHAPVPRPAALRILTPGEHPARTHAAALTPAGGSEGGDGSQGGETWVLVDQFEEVFTLCRDQAERARFLRMLLAAREPASRLRVVIAVRADFYGRCAEHRALADALSEAGLLVGPMSGRELREAVVRPAAAEGLIVERALTARVLRDVEGEPGGLPLMSHVLLETWRRRRGRTLTLEAYEAAGGLHGAIAQTAERIWSTLSPGQADAARRILLRLIAPGEGSQDTRRPVPRAELRTADADDIASATSDDTGPVLDRLAQARLLTLGDETVELSHEALITAWPRLRGWIEEDRERLRAHRRLTEAAQSWAELDRDAGALYRGTRLATAEELFPATPSSPSRPPAPSVPSVPSSPSAPAAPGHAADARGTGRDPGLTPLERDFLDASRRTHARERRRRRGAFAVLSTLVVLALVAGAVAWQQSRTSDRRHVEAEARRIAGVADSMRMSDPVQAMRLSVAAWRLADTPETRSALLGALSQPEEDAFTLPSGSTADGADGAGSQRLLSADGRTLVSAGPRELTRWDVPAHRARASRPGLGPVGGALQAALSPDGRRIAWADDRGRVSLRRTAPGARTERFHGAEGRPAGFSPSGRLLRVDDGLLGPREAHHVQLWDVRHRKRTFERRLRGDRSALGAVSHDDRKLALCPEGGRLELWRVGEGSKGPVPGGGSAPPADDWPSDAARAACEADDLAFTPDDRSLVSLDASGISVRDARTGRERLRIGHRDLTGMSLSRDGRLLVATDSQEILAWRLDGPDAPDQPDGPGDRRRAEPQAGQSRPVLRYPLVSEHVSGVRVDTEHGVIRYLSGLSGRVVRTLSLGGVHRTPRHGAALESAAFSPDGRTLATARIASGKARFQLLDARGAPLAPQPPHKPCRSGDGPGDETEVDAEDTGGEDDPANEANEANEADEADEPACTPVMAFSPDSRTLAYGTSAWAGDGALRDRVALWDTERGRTRARLDLSPRGARAALGNDLNGLAFGGPGGTSLLASRIPEGEEIEVWDPRRHKRTKVLRGAGGESLAVHPRRDLVVTNHGQLVEPGSGRVVRRALTQDETNAVVFSADGSRLAAGDDSGRVTLWDGGGRRSLGLLAGTSREPGGGSSEPVAALAFSPDGRTLAVAGTRGTLRLWDMASHQPLGTALPTGRDPLLAVAFSADGSAVRAVGRHTPVRRYPADAAHAVARVCARADGGLSRERWEAALPGVPYRPTC